MAGTTCTLPQPIWGHLLFWVPTLVSLNGILKSSWCRLWPSVPSSEASPCSSSQPQSSRTHTMPGLHWDVIQQNTPTVLCSAVQKTKAKKEKLYRLERRCFLGPGRDAYRQAAVQRHGWERILLQREIDHQTERRLEQLMGS